MAADAVNGGGAGRGGNKVRIVLWSLAAALVALPAVAMRFTPEVNWTGSDFVFAAVLIGGVGLLFELAVRRSGSLAYRAASAFALLAALMTVWANAAVGMIGSEDNGYNLLFLGVVALALLGTLLARLAPRGMAAAMAVTAAAQLAVSVGGMAADMRGGLLSAAFAGLWILSAALFAKAARDRG